ncbi:iron complex transport system substrate-binding protein [Actinobaculum suis]|uniref:ABC transporter substrate-binding protein n=1 Tax=Actinobaculum suis TaxID=1657 RepID=A0A1G7E6M7_9ACTO|nr:ABC transporter substrate-binding protein [Actinobaculum suis]MDY5153232.1 ABC transporter substrate-binding protein [Actinobaculum suis]SDE59116.1 iron complex transport system substrate-binding protein [Actinobaculum suis]VDG76321.1 metal ion ABC transporter substrate-binding protein [Actinobaculum suis]
MKKTLISAVAAAALVFSLSGCTGETEKATGPETGAIQIENCGHNLTFEKVPERVVLQNAYSVETLVNLGVLDHVVAKAGYFPEILFDDATNKALQDIPDMTNRIGESGHLVISKEAVMAEEPDAIFGASDSVNQDTTTEVPVIINRGFCGEVKNASWDDVFRDVDLYADIFRKQEEAEKYKAELQKQIDALDSTVGAGKKVAVLYPGVGGASTYAYGKDSMSNPVVKALGLENVFGDENKRVFEVTAEQIVAQSPDVVLILHMGEADAVSAVTSLSGMETTPAMQNDAIISMPLSFAEPPTPLAVKGAQYLEGELKKLK